MLTGYQVARPIDIVLYVDILYHLICPISYYYSVSLIFIIMDILNGDFTEKDKKK